MFIKIDIREQQLISQMNTLISIIPLFKNLKIVTENLPLGDVILLNEKGEEKIIIERKTINDLLSSIKDGRYKEQSYRLNGLNHPNHNIIYLIEGDVNKMNSFKDNKVEKLTIYSAIFSLNYFKGFSVIRTFNLEETAIFLCNTTIKLNSNKKPYYGIDNLIEVKKESENENENGENGENGENSKNSKNNENNENIQKESSDKDYVSVIKKVKKENVTTKNIGEIMLCQIPGISSVTALAVMEQFKTISNLIKELEKDETCLNNICTKSENNKSRKISKTAIISIINNLVKNDK
jgi:ERCC4-type nuclease